MPGHEASSDRALVRLARSIRQIVRGILNADPQEVEHAARQLGRTRRLFAPIAFVAGTLGLVIVGVKPIIKNWRLTLVELIPALWVWLSMWNLKSHVLDQRGAQAAHGGAYLPITLLFVAVAVLAFYCNAVFIFAIEGSPPLLRPALPKANQHLGTVLRWGVLIGGLHAFVSLVVAGWSKLAYDVSLSCVVALMMVTFVTVPASMAGLQRRKAPPRERVATAAVGGTIAAVASTPGFVLDRIGLLMIGTKALRIPGFLLLSIGVALQVAATSSTKAVKLSTRMVAGSVGPRTGESPTPSAEGGAG